MRLVDADALRKVLMRELGNRSMQGFGKGLLLANSCIIHAPTIELDWTEMIVMCDNCGHAIHVQKANAKPTIEPERKTGKWILADAYAGKRYRCSECLAFALKTDDGQENLSDYCPCCGAYMKGESND